nr:MAG TPA: hypothetical protein [Bacteriophage sp.]
MKFKELFQALIMLLVKDFTPMNIIVLFLEVMLLMVKVVFYLPLAKEQIV